MDQMSYQAWQGRDAYDLDGEKIGTIDNVFMDEQTGRPEWLAITTGFFGTKTNLVPIAGATELDDGLRLPYTKAQVKDAPRVDPTGSLTDDEERQLFSHYGYSYDSPNYANQDRIDSSYSFDRDSDIVGEATAVNEQPNIQQTENKVRLRKYRWTEQVPVQREEVRVENETDR